MGEIRIIDRSSQPFNDRAEAGRLLENYLQQAGLLDRNTVILGIPRGGIIIAQAIARVVRAEFNIVLARKLGAPGNPELAIGAVAEDGHLFRSRIMENSWKVSEDYLREEAERQRAELARRSDFMRRVLPRVNLSGRNVIITDDGVATGATMLAGLWTVKTEKPSRLTCAVPVAPEGVLGELAQSADYVICHRSPPGFNAVGQFYRFFPQIENSEVIAVLREEATRRGYPSFEP